MQEPSYVRLLSGGAYHSLIEEHDDHDCPWHQCDPPINLGFRTNRQSRPPFRWAGGTV